MKLSSNLPRLLATAALFVSILSCSENLDSSGVCSVLCPVIGGDVKNITIDAVVVDTTVPLVPPKVMRVQLPPEGSAPFGPLPPLRGCGRPKGLLRGCAPAVRGGGVGAGSRPAPRPAIGVRPAACPTCPRGGLLAVWARAGTCPARANLGKSLEKRNQVVVFVQPIQAFRQYGCKSLPVARRTTWLQFEAGCTSIAWECSSNP